MSNYFFETVVDLGDLGEQKATVHYTHWPTEEDTNTKEGLCVEEAVVYYHGVCLHESLNVSATHLHVFEDKCWDDLRGRSDDPRF